MGIYYKQQISIFVMKMDYWGMILSPQELELMGYHD